MCIYLGDKEPLHYDSAEHIIPAGIGGIQKLPSEYVSREFNTLSSKFELSFMRETIISIPRQILGPGKRGSLAPNKATKSSINVFRQLSDNSFSLGYIQQGKPFEIPHVVLNSVTGSITIGIDKYSSESEVQFFKQKLLEFGYLKIKMIKHSDLESHISLFGIAVNGSGNNECYIASKDGISHPFNDAILTEISNLLNDKASFSNLNTSKIRTHQGVLINDDYHKCCAKIVLNCLAFLKGKDFVTNVCFNPIKNWIINGGENEFVTLSPNHKSIKEMFPEDSHFVTITKIGDVLIADICFYNHFHNIVRLTDNFLLPFNLDGFICDWKVKKEYKYYEYMSKKFPLEQTI